MLKLSEKDASMREAILTKPLKGTLLQVALPLMVYHMLNNMFNVFDTMMASHIGSSVVSSVAYLSQVRHMIAAIGAGLSIAGGMLIAKNIGANDLKVVRQYVSTVFFLVITIGTVILLGMVIFAQPMLKVFGMPEALIADSILYFRLEMITLLFTFMNLVFIAIEKAKGNTKKIFQWNFMVMVIKLVSTMIFVYGFNKGINWLAFASILAHGSLTIVGTVTILTHEGVFRFNRAYIALNKTIALPLLRLALPVAMEKFTFSLGKVIVNGMSSVYGPLAVGALGVSNNIGGMVTSPNLGIQEAEAAIVSQNYGNGQSKRCKKAYLIAITYSLIFASIGTVGLLVFRNPIIHMFARDDQIFSELIHQIFQYEALAVPLLAISSSSMGFLYGLGQTKITLFINVIRLLGYRIPVLYILVRFTDLGPESLGIAMMVSNMLIGLTAAYAVYRVMRDL